MYDIGDDDLDRLEAAILADPAVQAAGDQLRAAARDSRPLDEGQRAALRALVRAALHCIETEAPGLLTPDVLKALARHFERPHEASADPSDHPDAPDLWDRPGRGG
jgi:hypothetical protein